MLRPGTEHSSWALWTTWRSGPDLVRHIAEVAAERTRRQAKIRIRYRDDEELAASGEQLPAEITGAALTGFRELVIEAGDDTHAVRITFVRKRADVLIGARVPRGASLRAGVVLEVMSSDPHRRDEVEATANALAAAIERGRPRWVTRRSRRGRSQRAAPAPGWPPRAGGSASRGLEDAIRGWPPRSGLPLIAVAVSVALYVGVIVVLAENDVLVIKELELALDETKTRWLLGGVGAVVAIIGLVGQAFMFASVEVNTVPNARRALKWVTSSVTLSGVSAALLKLVDRYFT